MMRTQLWIGAIALLALAGCEKKAIEDSNAKLGYDGLTPVHRAAASGDTVELENMLSIQRANPDVRDLAGVAPIHYAARAGHLDAVKMLVAYGADPTDRTSTGWTAFALAMREGHLDVVNFLSQWGFDPDDKTPEGEPYLAFAVRLGDMDLVRWLLERHADANVKLADGGTALDHYVRAGDKDGVVLLLNYGGRITRKGTPMRSPLHLAVDWKDVVLVNRLISAGADANALDEYDRTPSQHAADAGMPDMAEILANAAGGTAAQ